MKTAVILSGCGVRDGSEIHEAVSLLLSLDQAGMAVEMFAPDRAQAAVIDGKTGESMPERRNILTESQRIGRGRVRALTELDPGAFDAIVLPGGWGAALNLCDFATQGAQCTVDATLEGILRRAHAQGKVLGFMCIAPVIAARVFGAFGVHVTVGFDEATAQACTRMGAVHERCRADQACVDAEQRIVTVPAYMEATSIAQCYESAQALVHQMALLAAHP